MIKIIKFLIFTSVVSVGFANADHHAEPEPMIAEIFECTLNDGATANDVLALGKKDFNKFAFDLPYTNSVMANLGMYRSRLMKMSSKTCYSYHRDPTKRIHIPLITNDKCFFVIDDEVSYYPADGSHYLVDTTKKHTFVNASREDRIHIVGCTNEVV